MEVGDFQFGAKAEGGVNAIITRNQSDYVLSEIPVFSPDEFLAMRQTVEESCAAGRPKRLRIEPLLFSCRVQAGLAEEEWRFLLLSIQ